MNNLFVFISCWDLRRNYMKNKCYHQSKAKKSFLYSRTKRKLDELQRNGVKYVIWSLDPNIVPFVKKLYGATPYLYSIRTTRFSDIHSKNKLLKDLHYANKKGKEFVTRKLTEDEKEILQSNGVSYRTVKYWVTLN